MGSLLSREGGRRGLPGAPFEAGTSTWFPRIEMYEREGRLAIQADRPGLRNEDIDVRVEDDTVGLSGKREQETSAAEKAST